MNNTVIIIKKYLLFIVCFQCLSLLSFAQNTTADTTPSLSLNQCVSYGLQHQPRVRQSQINVGITRESNAITLGAWLPQVNATGNITHYLSLPTVFVPNSANPSGAKIKQRQGVENNFTPVLTVTQAIFSPQLAYAARSAPLYTQLSNQGVDSAKIAAVAAISKSFYSLLFTLQQINILLEDTARLNKNYNDAYRQYVAGTVDETDYDEASIELNNSKAQLRQALENIIPAYDSLKQHMGYPPEQQFNISFDTSKMMQEAAFDTTLLLQYDKRIELQQLQTMQKLQLEQTNYYKHAFLPTVSGFFNYDLQFQNNSLPSLFSSTYPYSYLGLSLSVPIFTGFSRIHSVRRSQLQEQFLNWSGVELKAQIHTEYTTAMANYKSSYYAMGLLRDNEDKASRTYNIVKLQYSQGVVPYLNVITAESNLISSQIGYLNALFEVMTSKIDLEAAMGIINTNY